MSDTSPVTPTAPTTVPSPSATSTPPAAGTIFPSLIEISPLISGGWASASLARARVERFMASADQALAVAIWGRMRLEPSSLSRQRVTPRTSRTATAIGGISLVRACRSTSSARSLAPFSVISPIDSLMIGSLRVEISP